MRKALITVNYGDFLKPNARASMQAAARRWKVDYFEMNEINTPKWEDRAPNAMKTTVFHLTPYDEIFIVDGDVIISGCCPNPFEAFPDQASMIAVKDSSPIECQLSSWAKHANKRHDLACTYESSKYFNTGMMLIRRKAHEEMMNFACDICREDFQCSWSDQTPINIASILKGVKVELVSEKWNYLSVQRFPHFMDVGGYPDGPFILHGAGDPSRERWLHEARWKC